MRRLVLLGLALLPACGGVTTTDAVDGGAVDPATSVRCFPGDPNPGYALSCRPASQFCVHDYAGLTTFGTNSCQPLPVECATKSTCDCVRSRFRCGLATTCSVSSTGIVVVTCQPD